MIRDSPDMDDNSVDYMELYQTLDTIITIGGENGVDLFFAHH